MNPLGLVHYSTLWVATRCPRIAEKRVKAKRLIMGIHSWSIDRAMAVEVRDGDVKTI